MAAPPDDLPSCSTQRHQVLFDKLDYKSNKMVAQDMFSSDRSKFKELIPPVLLKGVSIAALWTNAFSAQSNFLREYHDRRKNSDTDFHRWELAADRCSGTRQFSCQTIVEVPRAGSLTLLNEAHRFAYSSCDGGPKLLIHISSQTPDVPAGSTFRCEAVIQITADSLEGDCSVSVYGGMKKMSAMFAAIAFIATPRALKDMTACYMTMMELISEKLQGGQLVLKAAELPIAPAPVPEPSAAPQQYRAADSSDQGQEKHPWLSVAMLIVACLAVVALLLSISSLNTISASLQRAQEFEGVPRRSEDSPLFSGIHGADGIDDTAAGGAESPPVLVAMLARNEGALHKVLSVLHDLNARTAAVEQSLSSAWRALYVLSTLSVAAFGGIYYALKN